MLIPLREGITIDGETFQGMDVHLDRQQGANAWLTIGLREGKNREIRRAMDYIGLTVNRLLRISYGPFQLNDLKPGENPYDHRLSAAIAALDPDHDFIMIDCPGSHTRLSQVAHSLADTLITPLNDSFVDFDLLAKIDGEARKIQGPSVYSEMVWNARQLRAQAGLKPIDWIVLRNRLGAQNMVNKEKMGAALDDLAKRIGFRVAPGFNERVIFRELFPRGLTLLDLKDIGISSLNISNVAARQELRDLIKAINLPGVEPDF
jgi:chromosome partitioning protein